MHSHVFIVLVYPVVKHRYVIVCNGSLDRVVTLGCDSLSVLVVRRAVGHSSSVVCTWAWFVETRFHLPRDTGYECVHRANGVHVHTVKQLDLDPQTLFGVTKPTHLNGRQFCDLQVFG